MTYDGALAALQRALSFGMNPSLDGIVELTDALGRPQDGSRPCRSRAPTERHRPRG